jgi:hypothetical protein
MHDVAKACDVTFDQVRKWFYAYGCATFEEGWEGTPPTEPSCQEAELSEVDKNKLAAYEVMQELAGSDIDGLAADIEDFEAIGLL